ncbi:MAG: response regulator [Oryzomonas sp.]|jgi:YesN/AraC family two-component response regulator
MGTTPHGSAISLLIMEDDQVARMAICRLIAIRFPDIAVFTADNGRIGVELFKEHTPEMVITDINMPVMDGIQAAGEIKSIRDDTRFIVVTGHSDENYLERFSEIGYVDYIIKPIDFGKLSAAIERCRAEILQGHSRKSAV